MDLGRVNFLVVDDNHQMVEVLRTILLGFGASQVREANNLEGALHALTFGAIDIVIVDVAIGKENGIEFVKFVRTSARSPRPHIPMLLLTAHTELWRVAAGRDAGANEVLTKPVTTRALYERIHSTLVNPRPFVRSATYFGPDRRRHREGHYTGPERRQGAPSSLDALATSHLRSIGLKGD